MLAWPYAELRLGAKGAAGVPEDLQALLLWQWQVGGHIKLTLMVMSGDRT
jgi:hypothetical protein